MINIDINLKFAHIVVKENDIKIEYNPKTIQIGDLLTKALL